MRPDVLFPLFADVSTLKGVGAAVATALERLNIVRVIDLAFHLPVALLNRQVVKNLNGSRVGDMVIMPIRVIDYDQPRTPKSPMKVNAVDMDGWPISLSYFSNPANYVQKMLPTDQERVVSGILEQFNGGWQIVHPDYVLPVDKQADIPLEEPIYPLTEGISNKRMRTLVGLALERMVDLPEWIDTSLLEREHWPTWLEALRAVHYVTASDHGLEAAKTRLGYDELFSNQVALAVLRTRARTRKARPLGNNGERAVNIKLPFDLTQGQLNAVDDIVSDMATAEPMLRLLQGDVGSGKTVVALLAAARAATHTVQTAILAPTEILARQHLATFDKIGNLRVALLTGRDKGKAREKILTELAAGDIDVMIGTHALFTEDVLFHDLGLIIVDEQHRFGVHQRLLLSNKAKQPPHMLVMSATPIPRTLTLTVYGELDVSQLNERPPGRQAIDTRVVSLDRLDDVYNGLARALKQGGRAYWVCPLVEISEKIDLAAAEERAADLEQYFPAQVGRIHGRMKGAEKDAAMRAFANGEKRILVSTTVIEVGVDVPEANLMIIEQAERFGLAQLHQLRGRVGRGEVKSVCLLLRGSKLGEVARARLTILRETDDGFRIAEEDLRLRGAGELLGTRQSGLPTFKLVDPETSGEMMLMARDDARLLLHSDVDLSTERGQAARVALYLFERDTAAGLLRSG